MLSMIPTWVKWGVGGLAGLFIYEKVKHPGVSIRQDARNAFGPLTTKAKAKVIAAINNSRDPSALRQLGDGLSKAGAPGAAQMAHAKAATLERQQDAYVKPMQGAMSSDQPAGPVSLSNTAPFAIPGVNVTPGAAGTTDVSISIPGTDTPLAAFTVPAAFVPAMPGAVAASSHRLVKYGMKHDPDVARAQDLLIQKATGPAAGILAAAIAADPSSSGDFGNKTKNATIEFQTARGLGADGVIGAQTWAALES